MPDEERIRVQRPDGRYSTIPVSSLQQALARGYKYTPPSQPSSMFQMHGVPPLTSHTAATGYALSELGGGALDVAKSTLAPFDPRLQEGEKTYQYLDPAGLVAGRIVKGAGQLAGQVPQVPSAIRDIWRETKGTPYERLLQLLTITEPRTAGGVGAVAVADPLAKATAKYTRIGAQELAGAGREPVLQARIRYEQALKDYEESAAAKKSEYAAKVADARREWVNKSMEAKRGQAMAERHAARRESLARGQEAYADRLQQNLKQTYQTVKSRLDSRWHQMRSTPIKRGTSLTVLKDEPLNSKAIADTVETAEQKYLQGAPESLKQFRDLMNWMREEQVTGVKAEVAEEAGGAKPKLRPITWDEARTHYSALGDRMFSGDLPGNVRQAIRYVREEGLGKELRSGADRAGVLPQYESLLGDWSRFESDWRDTSSVTMKGGSPLARALQAPNAATLMPQVTGKTGDLLIERLARYKDAGGSPTTAAAIRRMNTQLQSMPKTVKAPAAPGKFEAPAAPKIGEPPTMPSPEAIRYSKLLERAGQRPTWWDLLFPPTGIEHAALKSPAMREWIASQARRETTVPRVLGGEAESAMEMERRRGPGEPPRGGAAATAVQRTLVDNLRMVYERQRAAGDPQMWTTGQKLRAAEDTLNQMEKGGR